MLLPELKQSNTYPITRQNENLTWYTLHNNMEKLWAFGPLRLHIGPWAYLDMIIYGPAGPHH